MISGSLIQRQRLAAAQNQIEQLNQLLGDPSGQTGLRLSQPLGQPGNVANMISGRQSNSAVLNANAPLTRFRDYDYSDDDLATVVSVNDVDTSTNAAVRIDRLV